MKSFSTLSGIAFSALSTLALASLAGGCSSTGTTSSNSPSDSAFCGAYRSYVLACSGQGAFVGCESAVVAEIENQCSAVASSFSSAFKEATTSCAPNTACPSGDPFLSSCFAAGASVLSAGQSKLASDACAACPLAGKSASECSAIFWGLDSDAGVAPGPGAAFVQYTDAIVEKIDATCLTGATACTNLSACAQGVVSSMAPAAPAACTNPSPPGDAGTSADGG